MPPAGGCSSCDRVTGTVHRRRETVSRSRRSFGGCLIAAAQFGSGWRATRSQKQTLCSDTDGMSPSVVSVFLMVLVVGAASLWVLEDARTRIERDRPVVATWAASRLTGRKCGRPCASWRWCCSCRSTSWPEGPSSQTWRWCARLSAGLVDMSSVREASSTYPRAARSSCASWCHIVPACTRWLCVVRRRPSDRHATVPRRGAGPGAGRVRRSTDRARVRARRVPRPQQRSSPARSPTRPDGRVHR